MLLEQAKGLLKFALGNEYPHLGLRRRERVLQGPQDVFARTGGIKGLKVIPVGRYLLDVELVEHKRAAFLAYLTVNGKVLFDVGVGVVVEPVEVVQEQLEVPAIQLKTEQHIGIGLSELAAQPGGYFVRIAQQFNEELEQVEKIEHRGIQFLQHIAA